MPPPEPVLICALSGRALAQSARRAGYAPIVLDAFADLDTSGAAAATLRVPVDRRWRFQGGALLAAAARLAPPPIPLVYGSGFERATGLLAELAQGRPLWGNGPDAIRAVKDPASFAAAARQLDVPHPDIRFRPPADPRGWLCKRRGGAGGGHVHSARAREPRGYGWYWQRWAHGRPVSALVAGNGTAARVLGCSEQWAAPLPGRRFRFAGILSPAILSPVAAASLAAAAEALVRHHALVGLASVDALVAGDSVTVLEVNPRPGASLDAYSQALGIDLFGLHRAACEGRLPLAPSAEAGAAGSLIVYARRAVTVAADFAWPAWSADRSPPGTRITAGGPIATVLAQDDDPLAVRALLTARACDLLARCERTDAGPVRPAVARRSSVG